MESNDFGKILNDDFQELSLQRKKYSQRMLNNALRMDYSSLNFCMKLIRRGPEALLSLLTKSK